MRFKEWLSTELVLEVTQVGYHEIRDKQLFGPVYHGTTEENQSQIAQAGFRVNISGARVGDTRHGYDLNDFSSYGALDVPPPVHHLGYGVYFTQVKSIAKDYNQGSGKNLKPYYLDVPRLETINFGSPNTMMRWWVKNGYNMESVSNLRAQGLKQWQIEQKRIEATTNLTNKLKSQFDAVLFKGQGLTRLLDGNQICVYDPQRIYLFNPELNDQNQFLAGDRAKIKGINAVVAVQGSRPKHSTFRSPWDHVVGASEHYLTIQLKPQDADLIKQMYAEPLRQVILSHPDYKSSLDTKMNNGGLNREEAANQYVDHLTSRSSLQLNFPEALLEKKLKKGERLKIR